MSRSHHQMELRSNKRAKSSRCQDCTTKWNKDQIDVKIAPPRSNERTKSQDVKIAPLNGPKNDQISRLQPPKSSRNYSCSAELPVSKIATTKWAKKIATINEKNKIK